MTTQAQTYDTRAVELSHMTKRDLIKAARDRGIEGGYAPIEKWTKDDLRASILQSEFPGGAR